MTDEKFTELVSLYLDGEISANDLKDLKSEIAARPDRKRAFVERCRLHEAMRVALRPEKKLSRPTGSFSRRRSSSTRSRSRGAAPTKISRYEESARAPSVAHFPRWVLASGVAASVLIGMMLLPPVFRDTTDPQSQPALVGMDEKDLVERDPLETLGKSELRRYEVLRQQRGAKRHASLIAQMRLMGLRPEHTPEDKELREVSLAAVYKPKDRVSQAERFQRIQAMRAIPEPKLLRFDESGDGSESSWPESSQHRLVKFGEL